MATTDVLFPQNVPEYPYSEDSFTSYLANSRKRKRSCDFTSTIPAEIATMAVEQPSRMAFDPAEHINHVPPKKIWTMSEIGRTNQGVSSNAVSEPFPLFTEQAVKQMRAEVLSKPVLENCQYSSNIAQCQLRGFAPKYAPFIYDAWHSPEVLSIISKIAGIDLVPVMDFEIAHINISINSKETQDAAKAALQEYNSRQADEGVAGCPWEDDAPVVDWHTDSYPFVCVLMLSDCTDMIGGETVIRTGTGDTMKVRGPGMGNAVVLQGRYIEHQALRALGGSERITMVTSFRPKSPLLRDDTVLTTVRPISNLSELYGGYAEYRLEMLEERTRAQAKALRTREKAGRKFDTAGFKSFLLETRNFIDAMLTEIVDNDKVTAGLMDPALLSDDLREQAIKKAKVYLGQD